MNKIEVATDIIKRATKAARDGEVPITSLYIVLALESQMYHDAIEKVHGKETISALDEYVKEMMDVNRLLSAIKEFG